MSYEQFILRKASRNELCLYLGDLSKKSGMRENACIAHFLLLLYKSATESNPCGIFRG